MAANIKKEADISCPPHLLFYSSMTEFYIGIVRLFPFFSLFGSAFSCQQVLSL